MPYLIGQIVFFLLLAAACGLFTGWLLWKIGRHTITADQQTATAIEIKQLRRRIRHLEAEDVTQRDMAVREIHELRKELAFQRVTESHLRKELHRAETLDLTRPGSTPPSSKLGSTSDGANTPVGKEAPDGE